MSVLCLFKDYRRRPSRRTIFAKGHRVRPMERNGRKAPWNKRETKTLNACLNVFKTDVSLVYTKFVQMVKK